MVCAYDSITQVPYEDHVIQPAAITANNAGDAPFGTSSMAVQANRLPSLYRAALCTLFAHTPQLWCCVCMALQFSKTIAPKRCMRAHTHPCTSS